VPITAFQTRTLDSCAVEAIPPPSSENVIEMRPEVKCPSLSCRHIPELYGAIPPGCGDHRLVKAWQRGPHNIYEVRMRHSKH